MIYSELDIEQEEIRLLRFDDSLDLDVSSKLLCMSIEKVSLNKLSADFARHASASQPCQIWNDIFFLQIECRRAALNPHHNTPQQIPPQSQTSTRFTWGDYEALSYAWGDGSHKTQIKLNGIVTQVSCVLEAALRSLQRLPETRSGMRYWVDALCINQADIKERSVQVKRMKKIYGSARSVVAWLGPASPDDKIAFQIMKEIYLDKTQNNRLFRPSDFGAEHWRALCAFVEKPYWNRLWIIQELAANQSSTLFICGTEELTRESLKLAARCCQKLQREEAPFICRQNDILEISSRLFRLINLASDIPKDAMLRKALSLSRHAMVSKEKDKVYGILALLDESVSSRVTPNYDDSTSIQDVFTALTAAVIEGTNCVEQVVYSSQYEPEWPSWVPDLRLPFQRHHMQYLRQRQASGNRNSKFSFRPQPATSKMQLRVEGIKVDYVDGVAASPTLGDSPVFPRHHNRRYGYSSAEALGKTLVFCHPKVKGSPVFMKIPWNPKNRPVKSVLWSSQEYLQFVEFRRLNQDFVINGQTIKSCFPKHTIYLPEHDFVRYHLRLMAITCKGRKLITTKTGYLGLVPECVQRQDLLVVLLGCNFPVLLRPYKDGYRVLGECYVQGLMAGEVFDAQKREHLPHCTFTLL